MKHDMQNLNHVATALWALAVLEEWRHPLLSQLLLAYANAPANYSLGRQARMQARSTLA
jgi:hypothetical protein